MRYCARIFVALGAALLAAAPAATQAAPDNKLGMAILAARVNGTTLVAGSGTTGTVANPNSAGVFHIQFDRDVSGCFYTVTLEDAFGQATALPSVAGANWVAVVTEDSAGNLSNRKFYLLVYCAR